ncbi:hypothetical protein HBH45_193840 [Parastagonospora nodorum]|nr:hypothetical protein HBH46_071980 [Parastagonospora nodorum]KAH4130785.1 hypothetical protein HBH45_193840 [Parastagonospora nodorum]KAH4436600.1 hypothetical protein HBH93_105580 [Parastagonospora nodorum]KAH4560293.1 hypothetical protein HBH84_194510 [Parastagonospora nodorum]KAH4696917.1 hypothetical protein HBH67_186320 [Parastagonospora nodorum]
MFKHRALYVPALVEAREHLRHEMNPYIYTTGRWLNNDQLHRDARRVDFDFAALCGRAWPHWLTVSTLVHKDPCTQSP